MKKEYLCVAYGQKKETGEPYAKFSAIRVGKGYAYVDFKDSFYTDEIVALLTVKTLSDE